MCRCTNGPELAQCPFSTVSDKMKAASPAPLLQRLTTRYHETEDRILITGALDGDRTVALWFGCRLLLRLLPVLLRWLEKQAGTDIRHNPMIQHFSWQAAEATLTPQAPVAVQADSHTWLVTTVDIQQGQEIISLNFRGEVEPMQVRLNLDARFLRQWLSILHGQWQQAEWPAAVWPAWLSEFQAAPVSRRLH